MIRSIGKIRLSLVLTLLLAGCTGWQSVLDAHGTSAISLKQLSILIVAVCSVVWMLVMVALIHALCRGPEIRPLTTSPPPETQRRMTIAVVTAVAATVLIIGGFTVMSFFSTRALSVAGGDDLTIKIRGLQW